MVRGRGKKMVYEIKGIECMRNRRMREGVGLWKM